MKNEFLIDEAAEYVGISRRSFERLNISYHEEMRPAKDGKNRKVRVYKKPELDRIKAEREKIVFKPATTNDALAAQAVTVSDLQMFAGLIVEAFQKENQKLLNPGNEEKNKKVDVSTFKDKLILNLAQAVDYSGLNENELRKALKDKKILAKKTSANGTWKINRESLDEFCKKYFE